MEKFYKLFLNKIKFSYDSFDRIVIKGYISSFHQAKNISYYFKEILCHGFVNRHHLLSVTKRYKKKVSDVACKYNLTAEYAKKGLRKEDYVRSERERFERKNKFGVYKILKSIENESTFRVVSPAKDSNSSENRLAKTRKPYTHYYFYIHDEILGNLSICIASYLPFKVTAYLNGHSYIERYFNRMGKKKAIMKKRDNAFLNIKDIDSLIEAKESLSAELIKERLDYWVAIIGPELEKYVLRYDYFIDQIEYCRNFIFKGHFFLSQLFRRSCELSMTLIGNDRIKEIFASKSNSAKIKKEINHEAGAGYVFKAFFKRCSIKQYRKFSNFLRFEVTCNHLPDLKLKKALKHLPEFEEKAVSILDRYSETEALMINAHTDVDYFLKHAKPVMMKGTKIPAIHVYQDRINRLLEVLLHDNAAITQFSSRLLRYRIISEFELDFDDYSRNQLTYDLRKLRAHKIVERIHASNRYRLTEYGVKVVLAFTVMRKRLYGPLHYSLFHHQPDASMKTESKLEKMYRQLDEQLGAIQLYLSGSATT